MKRVLVSGFSTFSDHKDNSSQIITELLKDTKIPGIELRTKILPVTFSGAFEELKKEMAAFQPDYIVSLGLAGNRQNIELEKVAINLIHTRGADNEGVSFQDHLIDEQGPVGHFSTLPLKEMREVATPFPVKMSFSAGTYVCNYLMYRVLQTTEGSQTKAGFIHLPHLKENQEAIFETLKALLSVCAH